MADERYIRILKSRLTEERYYHSQCVSAEAVKLAKKNGCDVEKARLAGLLHDIMKDTPNERQLQFFEEHGIILDDIEASSPKLWHAVSGSVYLRDVMHIPEDIANAVRCHTTGKAGMTVLEKILYTADFISADRNFEGVEKIREAEKISLDAAVEEALAFTVRDLSSRKLAIHEDTVRAYNEAMLATRRKNNL